jgi:hypothetical protein
MQNLASARMKCSTHRQTTTTSTKSSLNHYKCGFRHKIDGFYSNKRWISKENSYFYTTLPSYSFPITANKATFVTQGHQSPNFNCQKVLFFR